MTRRRLRAGVLQFLLALLLLAGLVPAASARDSLDLEKAVKIGSGETMVIEFTDPDCPYCRKAEAWFAGKRGITRYLFFIPLASHPDSKGKVQYILSAKDKARAYREVVSGRWSPEKLERITPEGIELQREHRESARLNGMNATPSFIIYGRIVVGFDQNKLEQLLP